MIFTYNVYARITDYTRTHPYIYRAVIETSISVFLVTQIDDWVQYCLMRHPKMFSFRKILRTRNAVEHNEQPRRYGKQVLMARHMIIGEVRFQIICNLETMHD